MTTKTKATKGNTKASNGQEKEYKQTECPVTKEQFEENATSVDLGQLLKGATIEAEPKVFSTGSFGYYVNGKVSVTIEVDGEPVQLKLQVGGNLIVVGSKPKKA